MSPEQYAKDSEHSHQVALFMQAQQNLDKYPELKWMYAIPNGGARTASVAASLKAEGVKAGVSDICLPVQKCGYAGFYIEMKKPGALKRTSKEQKEFGAFLLAGGYLFAVFDNWKDAWDAIEAYLEVNLGKMLELELNMEDFIQLP